MKKLTVSFICLLVCFAASFPAQAATRVFVPDAHGYAWRMRIDGSGLIRLAKAGNKRLKHPIVLCDQAEQGVMWQLMASPDGEIAISRIQPDGGCKSALAIQAQNGSLWILTVERGLLSQTVRKQEISCGK